MKKVDFALTGLGSHNEWRESFGTAFSGSYEVPYYDISYRVYPTQGEYSFSIPKFHVESAKNTDAAISKAVRSDYRSRELEAKKEVVREARRSWIHTFSGIERPR